MPDAPPLLLLIEDDEAFAQVAARSLTKRGFEVRAATSLTAARERLAEAQPDYAVLDLRLGDASGLSLLPAILESAPACRVVVLTGYASIPTAVEAIKLGAVNYLTKPVGIDQLVAALRSAEPHPELEPPEQPMSVRRNTWEYIQRVLSQTDGNVSEAARRLGMHRRTLQRILHKRPPRQ